MLFVFYTLLNSQKYQSITVEKVSYHDLSDVAKKASEVAQKMEQ